MPMKMNNEETVILEKFSNMIVEDTALIAVIMAIKANKTFAGIRPKRLINIAIRDGYVNEKIADGISYICPVNNNKGGEKMETHDYKNRFTSGEKKVTEAVLDHFSPAFKMGRTPSRMVFEECLTNAFPKIKNGRAATTKLINGGYLQEKDGKIILGEKGKEYLSL